MPSTWHNKTFDHLINLKSGTKVHSNVQEATVTGLSDTVVAKFATFEWDVDELGREYAAYRWIESKDNGPTFLGDIAEESS